jgi:mannose-6-phosphate isomerase
VKDIFELRNSVQNYAWGSRTALSQLLGVENPEGSTQAELWLGAHPKAPSEIRVDGRWESLAEWIARHPAAMLGEAAARRFKGELPFLLKVLAVAQPLSLQAHPSADRARRGFALENAAGLAAGDPTRNYRDARHKPELLCALTRFDALLGFRAPGEIVEGLSRLAIPALEAPLGELAADGSREALAGFFRWLMTRDEDTRSAIVDRALEGSRGLAEEPAYAWLPRLAQQHSGDIGVLAPLFLNLLTLEPGEAIYLPAGELHAYLAGTGVELMANSDNVLRGGLTPKHVDVPELLEVLSFEAGPPRLIRPESGEAGEWIYRTAAAEFELSRIELRSGPSHHCVERGGPEILLCSEGEALVVSEESGQRQPLERGGSVFVCGGSGAYRLEGRGWLERASLPTER